VTTNALFAPIYEYITVNRALLVEDDETFVPMGGRIEPQNLYWLIPRPVLSVCEANVILLVYGLNE